MNYRKILPTVEEIYAKFLFDFEEGIIYNKATGNIVGSEGTTGYTVVCYKKGEYYFAHRLIWKAYYREEPPLIIDHINEVKTDNRVVNLKKSDRAENKVKSSRIVNKSGYRGVYIRGDRSSYEVRVSLDKERRDCLGVKDLHVGYYHKLEEAAAAYNVAIKLLNLSLNYLNIVDFPENLVDTNKKFFKVYGGVSSQELT